MHKKILILIQSDPRESHRSCEGLRIALGLSSSGHHVSVLLAKAGLLVLNEEKEDLLDEDLLEKFLPLLHDLVSIFYVDEASVSGFDLSGIEYEIELLSKKTAALKITEADCFFTF